MKISEACELNQKAFGSLLPTFEQQYQQSLQSESRKRAVKGGKKAELKTITAKLFFILFYFKCYPTFDLAGFIFGIHRSQTDYWVHKLQLLEKA
ncbi:helix-turn-helix domain-containing protein [Pleurocapsa sp. FMAR1]|uniref:helix-turn-helix domain-containing protein n=1 Tax=Pleurocapsa sp. FMAR1 TaxID=3040204 RepID=UPI0029C703C4|nr:transposase family protein [Pleurocapsa sp. FMAR1]